MNKTYLTQNKTKDTKHINIGKDEMNTNGTSSKIIHDLFQNK